MPFGFTLYGSFILSKDEQSFARRNMKLFVNNSTDDALFLAHVGKSDARMLLELRLYLCLKQIHCDGVLDMFITAGTCPFVSLRQFPYREHARLGDFDSVWVDKFQVNDDDETSRRYNTKAYYTSRNKEEQSRKDFIADRELQRRSFVALSWINALIRNKEILPTIHLIKRAAATLRIVAGRIQDAVALLVGGYDHQTAIDIKTTPVAPSWSCVRNWEECVGEVRRVFDVLITNKCTRSGDESDIVLSVTGLWRSPFYCATPEATTTVRLSDVIKHLVDGETAVALRQSVVAAHALTFAAACLDNATQWVKGDTAP